MAENTKNTKTEIGTIGQEYENRKTHKRGVLISRNEKYKTLQMKGEDDKAFDVVYSTFKSDWRKYQGADAKTAVKSEEKSEEEKAEPKPAKEKKEKAEKKPKVDKQEVIKQRIEAVKSTNKVVEDVLSKLNLTSLKTKVKAKGSISVRHNRKSMCEIWVKPENKLNVYVCSKISLSGVTADNNDNWMLKFKYSDIPNTEKSITELFTALKPEVETRDKELAKKEAEKTKNTKKEG